MRDVLVLCYHAVSPHWEADLSITPTALDAQVKHLTSHGWQGTTFSEAVLGSTSGRVLAVTFDDAFGSVKEYAGPIMARHGVPATVFAPTEFMRGGAHLAWPGIEHWGDTASADELQAMDWSDLRGLADAGWEIGSHTCTHPSLPGLDDTALSRELVDSKAACSDQLGRECSSIAYPYGDVDSRVTAAAAAAGYRAGARLSSDLQHVGPYSFPRVGVYNTDQWSRFRLKVARPVRRIRATRLWPQTSGRSAPVA
jgi:peptidoglycan/xylan/chitin deacetylase (PgdA/CDA1 family)